MTSPRALLLLLALLLAAVAGCPVSGPPEDAPGTHTLNEDGIWHAPITTSAEDDCGSCHGITEPNFDIVACVDCHSVSSIQDGSFEDEGDDDDDEDDDDEDDDDEDDG